MENNPQLSRALLHRLIQANAIDELSLDDIIELFIEEYAHNAFKPNPISQVDPRNGEPIFFNARRASRPHTYGLRGSAIDEKPCPICKGKTTGILDWTNLSEGFTFINKNLFPVFFPFSSADEQKHEGSGAKDYSGHQGHFAQGLHFLQWTSSLHDKDWHNMPDEDCFIVMKRLAALEKKLLEGAGALHKYSQDSSGHSGFVSIVKNVGGMVGGSLVHGHQQIVLSNIMPRRLQEHWRFKGAKGKTFVEHMLDENPPELLVRDYGAAILLVPYFMRRPYDMMLIVKDGQRCYCHDLNDKEVMAVSKGWKDAISAIEVIMPEVGREVAYNVITHNGGPGGLYFEFLPYTQEFGGLEQLGMTMCQADPYEVSKQLRRVVGNLE